MVLKLPDSQISTHPYDASFMDLWVILQKTTEGAVIKCLLNWGVQVREEDIICATRRLSDSQIDTYELILSHSTHQRNPLHSCVNLACNEALKMRKKNFVIALDKWGSTPPSNQLYKMGDVLDDQSHDEQMASSSGKVNKC